MKTLMLFVIAISVSLALAAQESGDACPMHAQHAKKDAHHAGVDARGDQAMGFPQDKTTHHFRLRQNGGAIEVTANDPADKQNAETIRQHLSHITVMFRDGDFSTPMFIHDRVPPGVPVMKDKREQIQYTYESIPAGARIRIATSDEAALAAVQQFLRFQIEDHQTGDPTELPRQ